MSQIHNPELRMENLKGKTILIGKDSGQPKLKIAIRETGRAAVINGVAPVPDSVSRCMPEKQVAHASLSIDENGSLTLSNLKSQNVTWVNGKEIESKRLPEGCTVCLGRERYPVDVPLILKVAAQIAAGSAQSPQATQKTGQQPNAGAPFDISHLRKVYQDYDDEMERIARTQQDLAKKRMLPIMVSSASGIVSGLVALVSVSTLAVSIPITAVVSFLYFKNYNKKDTSYEDRKQATETFQDTYVCPNPECNKFLGNLSYKLLKKQYGLHCPYCKCEYVEGKEQ